ncbi:MAG: DNA primase [Ardenticatenaceae bacterium]|nr:DNA primase [Ardenticatenaceae bacterium]
MDPIQEIKNRLDIVELVSETVNLRKSGRSYTGFCPFHSNTRTPSFVVFPETQTWRCFGACAEGGDIFSYFMKRDGVEFREALVQLAARAGVQLEEPDPQKIARKNAQDHLVELLEAAAGYFHQLFLHAPQAQFAREYIDKRGFTAETIDTFRIGFALNSWNAARDHFLGQGYSEEDLIKVGLLTVNEEKGTRYDRFRNRLMIPIRDMQGRVVGFGARTLDPDGIPKYLNSPQNELFDKSNLLFGLDMARRHIREARQAVIVEGYMDVIMAWQAGFRNMVAQMGTALTPTQLNLLKRVTKRFVIALDADAAGVNATLRSLDVARKTLDREEELRFDPTGLIKEEGRLQADMRIVSMPPGEDPDSLIRQDPALFARRIEGAKPVVEYVIDVLSQETDLNDPKNKTQLAEKVIPLIRDVASPVEREHFWQLLARTLRVDDRALKQLYVPGERRPVVGERRSTKSSPPPKPTPQNRARSRGDGVKKIEENFLRECLIDPLLIRRINRMLSQEGQSIIHAEDFSSAVDRTLFVVLNQQQSLGVVASIEEIWDSLDALMQQRVQQLMQLSSTKQAEREKLPERLVHSVLDWRLRKANQLNDELKLLIREAKQEADVELVRNYTQQHAELTRQIYQVNRAKAAIKGISRRRS